MNVLLLALSQLANNLSPAVFGVCGVAVLVVLGRHKARELARAVAPPEGALYAAHVRASVRSHSSSAPFTSLKNGTGGILLTVSPNAIVVTAVGGGLSRVARLLGVQYEAHPGEVSMSTGQVGWAGTFLGAKDSVVLTPTRGSRRREIALYPYDGDLARLKAALRSAGVSTRAQPAELQPTDEPIMATEPRTRNVIGAVAVALAICVGGLLSHEPGLTLLAVPVLLFAGLQAITIRRGRRSNQ